MEEQIASNKPYVLFMKSLQLSQSLKNSFCERDQTDKQQEEKKLKKKGVIMK